MASVFLAILLFPVLITVPSVAHNDSADRELRPGVPVEGAIQFSHRDTYFLDLDAALISRDRTGTGWERFRAQ